MEECKKALRRRKRERSHTDSRNHYLDFANFIGLELWSAVVVDEADATC